MVHPAQSQLVSADADVKSMATNNIALIAIPRPRLKGIGSNRSVASGFLTVLLPIEGSNIVVGESISFILCNSRSSTTGD
jgi:hypothetical protein